MADKIHDTIIEAIYQHLQAHDIPCTLAYGTHGLLPHIGLEPESKILFKHWIHQNARKPDELIINHSVEQLRHTLSLSDPEFLDKLVAFCRKCI